jgi:hypothetical protein
MVSQADITWFIAEGHFLTEVETTNNQAFLCNALSKQMGILTYLDDTLST